jgi:hypothetical protein
MESGVPQGRYDVWFFREVEKGPAASDENLMDHRDVLAMIDQRYPETRD